MALSQMTREVWAWAESNIPFDNLTSAARELRSELRTRIRGLSPRSNELLYASYSGPKHRSSDVENILLYNIDSSGSCFRRVAANGVRFELAAADRRSAHSGRAWGATYQYATAPLNENFRCWTIGSVLASFNDIDLGSYSSQTRLAQTWLALRRTRDLKTSEPRHHETEFGVRLLLSGPRVEFAAPELVKSAIDGVVAAFQAHGDRSSVHEIARRISQTVEASAQEVSERLRRR